MAVPPPPPAPAPRPSWGARLKQRLLENRGLAPLWGAWKRGQLHRRYTQRREMYARQAAARGLVYREPDVVAAVRERLRARGYTPTVRAAGDVHTFAVIPDIGWHRNLLPDLEALGPVTWFDYVARGFRVEEFSKADRHGLARRQEMNDQVLPALRDAHARRPVDWVFVYASGVEISADTVRRVADETGLPTVNMCLDDKQSWTGTWMGDHPAGQVGLAPVFDLTWTSARVACEWYLVEGGRPLYMPEGFDAQTFHPVPAEPDIPVSFVGTAYGFRPAEVRYLRRHGVPIHCVGSGWGTRASGMKEVVELFNRSRINLGMGGIGYSPDLTNVKGRDFEVPATGGGVYLTSFNPDLAQHFVVGQEILCYRNQDEMLELIRCYLQRPDEARQVAARGRERCLKEHRWYHRYQRLCSLLGIIA